MTFSNTIWKNHKVKKNWKICFLHSAHRGVTAGVDPRGSAQTKIQIRAKIRVADPPTKIFTEVSEVIFLNSNSMVTLLYDNNKFVLRFLK
jgi:hypothetical protein